MQHVLYPVHAGQPCVSEYTIAVYRDEEHPLQFLLSLRVVVPISVTWQAHCFV